MTMPLYPVSPPPPKRRLTSWQISLLVAGAVVLVVCLCAGVVGALSSDNHGRQGVTAQGGPTSTLAGTPQQPGTSTVPAPQPSVAPTDLPSIGDPPAPGPSTPAGTPTKVPTKAPTKAPTKTKTPTPKATHTHSGTVTPGAFCASSEHYWYGVSSKGKLYQCLDNNGWRWEPV